MHCFCKFNTVFIYFIHLYILDSSFSLYDWKKDTKITFDGEDVFFSSNHCLTNTERWWSLKLMRLKRFFPRFCFMSPFMYTQFEFINKALEPFFFFISRLLRLGDLVSRRWADGHSDNTVSFSGISPWRLRMLQSRRRRNRSAYKKICTTHLSVK